MTTAPELRRWRVEIPPRAVLINANENLNKYDKARRVKALRNTGWAMARAHKVPALQRAHIFYVFHPDTANGKRRRDSGNWSPSAKALVDGFVDAGVLPDDTHEHLLGPDPRIGDPVPGSQIVLYITDLDSIPADHLALLNPPNGGTSWQ